MIKSRSFNGPLLSLVSIVWLSCAYFNTYYNAEKYFNDADKLRLEKEGKSIPLSALDKYGKTIQKCQKVLKEYPESELRINAILLMGKARYYRREYDDALMDLRIVNEKGDDDQVDEAQYWVALCKWKKGTIQPAIDELTLLIKNTDIQYLQAMCHLSLAEIAEELKDEESILYHLEIGADLMRDRAQRGVIYGKLAEFAFQNENYEVAITTYNKVIKNSLSKEKVEDSHLQVLRILRMQGNYRAAAKKIKTMLTDEKFKNIAGNLELELVQHYMAQNEIEEAISRLETIINDYQRTKASAEAYFLLGQIHITEKWEPVKAKEFFDLVKKEYGKSIYKPVANNRSTSIESYLESKKQLELYLEASTMDSTLTTVADSGGTKNAVIVPEKSHQEILYHLGDLETFSFDHFDEGVAYFKKILDQEPTSQFHPKALFTLSLIFAEKGDSASSHGYSERLISEFPDSDYASYVNRKNNSDTSGIRPIESIYARAELLWLDDPLTSMEYYKDVIAADSLSELSASAAFFLGYHYDNTYTISDSALKYYQLLKKYHPRSDQAAKAQTRISSLQLALSSIVPDTALSGQ